MSPLSDRIAAEHQAGLYPVNGVDTDTRFFVGDEVESRCSCGDTGPVTAHLADVTERAVRDTIAAELEAKAADLAAPRHDGEEITGFTLRLVHAEHLTNAARIAREGTTP